MTHRIRILTLLGALLALLLTAGPSAAQGDPRSEILQRVNQLRLDSGLPAWRVNAQLAAAAQEQANWMAATNLYLHSHGGSTPYTRAVSAGYRGYVSEIIVGGYELTPAGGVTWWLNSAVHYGIMVSGRYVEAGSGYAVAGNQAYYVIVVGTPDANVNERQARAETVPEPIRVVPIVLAAPRADGSVVHVVQEGQTPWAIAARYEVDLAELLWMNGLADDDFVRVGDEIMVRPPEGWVPPPTPTPPTTHIVKKGQTLWTIAALYRLRLDDLLWLNGLSADALIRPGDELTVRFAPGQVRPPTPSPTPVLKHTVRSGQTLWTVAALHGLSLEQLLAYNGLTGNPIIRPGDELWVVPPVTPTPVPTAVPVSAAAVVSDSAESTPTPTPIVVALALPSPTAPPTPAVTAAAAEAPPAHARAAAPDGQGWLLLALSALFLTGAGVLLLRR